MRLFLAISLAFCIPAAALAQRAPQSQYYNEHPYRFLIERPVTATRYWVCMPFRAIRAVHLSVLRDWFYFVEDNEQ